MQHQQPLNYGSDGTSLWDEPTLISLNLEFTAMSLLEEKSINHTSNIVPLLGLAEDYSQDILKFTHLPFAGQPRRLCPHHKGRGSFGVGINSLVVPRGAAGYNKICEFQIKKTAEMYQT